MSNSFDKSPTAHRWHVWSERVDMRCERCRLVHTADGLRRVRAAELAQFRRSAELDKARRLADLARFHMEDVVAQALPREEVPLYPTHHEMPGVGRRARAVEGRREPRKTGRDFGLPAVGGIGWE